MTRLILHIVLCQEKSVGIKFNNLLSSIKSSNTISPTFIKRNLKVENKKLFLKLTCSNLKSLVNLRSCPLHMKLQVLHSVRLDYANSLWTLIKDVYRTNERGYLQSSLKWFQIRMKCIRIGMNVEFGFWIPHKI